MGGNFKDDLSEWKAHWFFGGEKHSNNRKDLWMWISTEARSFLCRELTILQGGRLQDPFWRKHQAAACGAMWKVWAVSLLRILLHYQRRSVNLPRPRVAAGSREPTQLRLARKIRRSPHAKSNWGCLVIPLDHFQVSSTDGQSLGARLLQRVHQGSAKHRHDYHWERLLSEIQKGSGCLIHCQPRFEITKNASSAPRSRMPHLPAANRRRKKSLLRKWSYSRSRKNLPTKL